MFEIMIAIIIGCVMLHVHEAFNRIETNINNHNEKINNGWIDCRTKSAY